MTEDPPVPAGVDPTVPSPARLYDYYLGGRYNFPADRAAAKRIIAALPDLPDAAWANRSFHQRAARCDRAVLRGVLQRVRPHGR